MVKMNKWKCGVKTALTDTEIFAMQEEQRKAEIAERTRPLTEAEVSRMIITEQINTLAVDDQTALRMREFYPEWQTGKAYSVGFKVRYGSLLYKVATAHTSQADWTPDVAPTLFTRIDETHSGTEDDPIQYSGNMALENGKCYVQDGEIYKCIRDTVNPVYDALADLVGIYVEVVE
jgi:hypothetical protein